MLDIRDRLLVYTHRTTAIHTHMHMHMHIHTCICTYTHAHHTHKQSCDFDCQNCGSQDYCDNYSPYMSDSGTCDSSYTPPPGVNICANYYERCSHPSGGSCNLCGGTFNVGDLIMYTGSGTFCQGVLSRGAIGTFAGTNDYTPPVLASWDNCLHGTIIINEYCMMCRSLYIHHYTRYAHAHLYMYM